MKAAILDLLIVVKDCVKVAILTSLLIERGWSMNPVLSSQERSCGSKIASTVT